MSRSAADSPDVVRHASSPPVATDLATPVFDSARLLQGGREILIRHAGECYRLRHTRNDKLILTK